MANTATIARITPLVCRDCTPSVWCEYHAGDPCIDHTLSPAVERARGRLREQERERERRQRQAMYALSFQRRNL